MITAVTSSATVALRLFRQKCASLRCLSPRPAGQSASGQDVRATPLGSATRRGQAPGWPRSGQPWRAFQRGFRLLSTNTLRPRRTTTDPAFCFNARSEFLAFIVRRPFGPSSLLLQVVEAATIFFRSNSRPGKTRAISHATAPLERCGGLPPGEMPMEPFKHCARCRSCRDRDVRASRGPARGSWLAAEEVSFGQRHDDSPTPH